MVTIEVIKTLVIGVGTTGTRVAQAVADRAAWEYGGLEQAPWIRYLCLETDQGVRRGKLPESAVIRMGVTPEQYANVLKFAHAYDEYMDLQSWADKATLAKLPANDVSGGAGNIRMVGRLAFFFPENYNKIRNAIEGALKDLWLLTAADAQEQMGKLPDGSTPDLVFVGGGSVRIFVVGSLCGGTCSGLASDIGYVVNHIKKPEDKSVAIFGLPLPQLSTTLVAQAERFKVNAYAALTELNHYHLPGIRKPHIKAGNEVIETTGTFPYDAIYLVMPQATGAHEESRLVLAMADRIFLNASVPGVDPFAKLVDATVVDRSGHAHVFCTFGLHSIEFPKQKVIEGCTLKLLLEALRMWRRLDTTGEVQRQGKDAVSAAGIRYDVLKQELLRRPNASTMDEALNKMIEELATCEGKHDLRDAVAYIRAVLGTGPSAAPREGAPLKPGDLVRHIGGRLPRVVDSTMGRVFNQLKADLLTEMGLAKARALVDAAFEVLDKLGQTRPGSNQAEVQATDAALDAVPDKRGFWPRSNARFREKVRAVQQALRAEKDATVEMWIRRAISGSGGEIPDAVPYVQQARNWLTPTNYRLRRLENRVSYQVTRLDSEVRHLASTGPTLMGVPIFQGGTWDSTVLEWYRRELGDLVGDESRWEQGQKLEAKGVLQAWGDLAAFLRPGQTPDWLGEEVDPDEELLIPEGFWEKLIQRAREPFLRLRARSVVDEMLKLANWKEIAHAATTKMRELLSVDLALATKGGRSPIQPVKTILYPQTTAAQSEVVSSLKSSAGDVRMLPSPDTSRIVFLSEVHRFPLYGAPDIVGNPNSLATAQCRDFPVFYSRKDVYWTGLSEEEHDAQLKAEESLVVALLLGVATLERGRILLQRTPKKLGDPTSEDLPFSIDEASRVLNPHKPWGMDAESQSLLYMLIHAIKRREEQMEPNAFVRKLIEAYNEGVGAPLPDWQARAGEAMRRYCSRSEALYTAYRIEFPPSADLIQRLFRRRGDRRPIGGQYDQDGLYCLDESCCGWVGTDERNAALNGWRCFICGRDQQDLAAD